MDISFSRSYYASMPSYRYTACQFLLHSCASRLSTTTWRMLIDVCIAVQLPTKRGCRRGAWKQRTIDSVIGHRPPKDWLRTCCNNNNLIVCQLSTSVGVGHPCVAKLNVHCINVRSVKNKAVSVSDFVISRDIDILALTETWLGSAIDGHMINTLVPCGYKFRSVSRPHGTCGGGVAMLYKSGLTVKPIPMRDNYTNFEHSDYYVTIRSVTFRLCVVYRLLTVEVKQFF